MSNYKRVENIEEAYFRLHGIRPEIYFDNISPMEKNVKVILNGKEAFMNQKYERNRQNKVELILGENSKNLTSVYEAELEINDYLRSVL